MLRFSLFGVLLLQLFLSCSNGPSSPEETPGQPQTETVNEEEALVRKAYTTFDGINISYLIGGAGEPVLLVHGFINSAASWEKTALTNQLLSQGYQVIIPDLRGNGESDKPQTDEGYVGDAEVKDLSALVDHLNLDRLMAVGYSRGSIVLAKWLTTEQRVYRAVIGGMGLDFTNPDWDRRLAFADAFGGGELTDLTRGAVEYAKSINADLRSLHLQQKHQPVTSKEAIRDIRIPISVVAGNEDLDNGFPGRLEELFPKGKLTIIPGDHNTTYRTEVFGAAVMAFLKAEQR